MEKLVRKINPNVKEVFDRYPDHVQGKMLFLRGLIIETAEESEGVDELEETLKWGESSYLTKNGSTIRMDWKAKVPDQYALYFQCTSRLVDTFRMVFDRTFHYEGNRAIIFAINQEIPVPELKDCIKAALRYHKVKDQLTLGI